MSNIIFLRAPRHIFFKTVSLLLLSKYLTQFFPKNLFSGSGLQLLDFNSCMQPSAPSRWGWWQGLVAGQSLAGTCCAFAQSLPAIASIWVETLLSIGPSSTIYHLCPQTEQDHTGLETNFIYPCFVWVTVLTCYEQELMHKNTWDMMLVCFMSVWIMLLNFVTFWTFVWVILCICVVLKLQHVVGLVKSPSEMIN